MTRVAKPVRRAARIGLLLGVSLIGLGTARPAGAQSISALRGVLGIPKGAVPPVNPTRRGAAPVTKAQILARQRALANIANGKTILGLAAQAQAAARAAAIKAGGVPDGLGAGGLKPVDNPVASSADLTGLHTWQGASAPTQSQSGGQIQVTVDQTESRALLSWETFNVGANTTLTFNQKQNGVAKPDWVAVNRVVGRIDPSTGMRDPGSSVSASKILGSIKADGTVIVINPAGMMFGANAKVNTHSLLVSSLEMGRSLLNGTPLTLRQRNDEFLSYGLLGIRDQLTASEKPSAYTFSPQLDPNGSRTYGDAEIRVERGAQITSGTGGYVIALAPQVLNYGTLSATQGQVSLQSGRYFLFDRSEGDSDSLDPAVRGLLIRSESRTGDPADYVLNGARALITSNEGFVSLGASNDGAVRQAGIITATTSVSRNGAVDIDAGDIRLDPDSLIWVQPDEGKETIPQSADSIANFKTSRITIGSGGSRIEMGAGSMILAPSANVTIGAPSGSGTDLLTDANAGTSRIFLDAGAVIDVGGVKDLRIANARNTITIDPLKGNELRDSPLLRDSFLNGATVTVDPRASGVRADGVRWIGSPLIEAASYYAQVGVSAAELMTDGGSITLGVSGYGGSSPAKAADIIVKPGAVLDVSGGWVRYEGGTIKTTRLVTRGGQLVDISQADPYGDYIAIAGKSTESLIRYGISATYSNAVISGERTVEEYSEGRDAGSITLKGPAIAFDGTIRAEAYAGSRQINDARPGSAASAVYGDLRGLQAAPSELPSGGYLNVQALSLVGPGQLSGGGDIRIGVGSSIDRLSSSLDFGQSFGFDANGALVRPERSESSLLGDDRRTTIQLSQGQINAAGLSQVNLQTSGAITVDAGATLSLEAGGAFTALAGRTITINGGIAVPSGVIGLQTVQNAAGSLFADDPEQAGAYDIVINGRLSARGRWANDYLRGGVVDGGAYLDGGAISMAVASRAAVPIAGNNQVREDISGSILINDGALIDLSGGGYAGIDGRIDTSGRGGDLTLISQTNYFQLTQIPTVGNETEGNVPGIRVTNNPGNAYTRNPAEMNARIALDGTILAHGFAGGGTFSLTTPAIRFGSGSDEPGTDLALDFFSKTGFGAYAITSYGTQLIENRFRNALGGYNAILATQTLTVGDGQTLNLTQSRFSPMPAATGRAKLLGLASGDDLYSVLTPSTQDNGWDKLGIDLTLAGLVELHVAEGGRIVGNAGASLTATRIWNEGTIRLIGGSITQSETLPNLYATAIGAARFEDFFTVEADGTIKEGADNALGIRGTDNKLLTNAQLALQPLYLTGALGQDEGIRLGAGSVTDLSGASIRNPYLPATLMGQQINGRLDNGGTLATVATLNGLADAFRRSAFTEGVFSSASQLTTSGTTRVGRLLVAEAGARIDLSGASDHYTYLNPMNRFVETDVWSAGGTLSIGAGGTLAGAVIDAHGGAAAAAGGTLSAANPVLVQADAGDLAMNLLAADQIMAAGFDSFVARGSLSTQGDVHLSLDIGFTLQSRPYDGLTDLTGYVPTLGATGALSIDAAYIRLDSYAQFMATPFVGTAGTGSVRLSANTIDVNGAVLFDRSVAEVTLDAAHDLRLIGARPIQQRLGIISTEPNSLLGQLVVNGDLTLNSGQVYPTTGSSFLVASTAAEGVITIGQNGATPKTLYSAAGQLLVQADTIVQGGTLRAPLGSLTLGGNAALIGGGSPFTRGGSAGIAFAPATRSVTLAAGSTTSVSAKGLNIPYGFTTDQIEWYFTPTQSDPLTAPPTGVLHLAGASVELAKGATVDISGGGDVYAYEFVPGTGGSHDVLDRFNNDPYSSNDGYQYADGRQVYAIVPGLSAADVAAYDPIYSADYDGLYSGSQAGRSVYLSGVPGLAAGMYTLLPAKYALLPGGMRIVAMPDTTAVIGGAQKLADGSVMATGYYGIAGTGIRESTPVVFSIQDHATFAQYSKIVKSSANDIFAARALRNGVAIPRLPVDAGRIILEPLDKLLLEASLTSKAGKDGRGALADISGDVFRIVSAMPAADPGDGAILLTADGLTGLNAESLFIGGVRTANADGSTSLTVRARAITIENDAAHPLSAPELLFATDGAGSTLTVADGAAIRATGTSSDRNAADYVINGSTAGMTGQGNVLRVANAPERLITRKNVDSVATPAQIAVGNATLSGTSVLIGSSGNVAIDTAAAITAKAIALDATRVTFAADGTGLFGLVITPKLQGSLASADHLTIRSSNAIAFENGQYSFGDVLLDSAGFQAFGSAAPDVRIKADSLQLANSVGALSGCTANGALACGSGSLALTADTIHFGSGTLRTYGFGGATSIEASKGITYTGIGGFDAGPAAFTVTTPFIADGAIALLPDTEPVLPSLSLTTTGALAINGTAAATALPDGTPGARLTLGGQTVSVVGSHLRATAGQLSVNATGTISIGKGAILDAPSYAKQFGDDADPYLVSAPGGRLALTSTEGSILLVDGGALSVGGSQGEGGTLVLRATKGEVSLAGGTIDGRAPDGGASLAVDTGGSFDLAAFAAASNGFTHAIDIRSGTGDLTLAAGSTLDVDSLLLVSENGLVDIAGTIDTSGVNGGAVSLYGRDGVHLASSAVIDASADGYALTDSRQAVAGDVLLGTDGTGVITVDAGATIDLSAKRTDNRLIPVIRNGETLYSFVGADVGGTLILRAPLIERAGADTANVAFGGTVSGAREIALEAYKRWDLADIAADSRFTGVKINANGTAELDTGETAAGRVNFLSAIAPDTIPTFIRTFDVSGAYAGLGTLAASDVFVARPGVELSYDGDIKLASNWNFAAGEVDVNGAIAAGVMRNSAVLAGKVIVNAGREAELIEDFTSFLYRVSGSIHGAAGALSLRAGGNLVIDGSITDGLFTFGDQTDPDYLKAVIGSGGTRQFVVPFTCAGGPCSSIVDYSNSSQARRALVNFSGLGTVSAGGATPGMPLPNDMPFNALANSAAARGAGADGAGDPLGSASLFPLLSDGSYASSWNYGFTGGADLGSGGSDQPSVDPLRVNPASTGSVSITGKHEYSYTSAIDYLDQVLLGAGGISSAFKYAFAEFLDSNGDGRRPKSTGYTNLSFQTRSPALTAFLRENAKLYFSDPAHGSHLFEGGSQTPTSVNASAESMRGFLLAIETNLSELLQKPATGYATGGNVTTVSVRSLVRTGTGSISVAAPGNVDLRNGAPATGRIGATDYQIGGTAMYTVGHAANTTPVTAIDVATGVSRTIDPTAHLARPVSDGEIATVNYGRSNAALAGILISDPVYAEGGGDIAVKAGGSIFGRRDAYGEAQALAAQSVYSFSGAPDQPWRVGSVGQTTNMWINPQLFQSGIGALGGGSLDIVAGGDVSDLTLVSLASVTTGDVLGTGALNPSRALMTYGGGNIDLVVDNDLRGGRIDLARGSGSANIAGAIRSAGTLSAVINGEITENLLRIRVSDASFDFDVGGSVRIQGISALGVNRPASDQTAGLNSYGFYSPSSAISIIANGSITSLDRGVSVTTTRDSATSPRTAVYPATAEFTSLNGDLALTAGAGQTNAAATINLFPSPNGQLRLFAGGDIDPVTITMEDRDPGLLPGFFSSYSVVNSALFAGQDFNFPMVLPTTTDAKSAALHNSRITHAGDDEPVRIQAGGDITDMILSAPKQVRIGAGNDIVNMMLFAQNLEAADISRVVAGRDIIATSVLTRPYVGSQFGDPQPALQGNTFVIGGPGTFSLEAGRDAGPFLNSAVVNPSTSNGGTRFGEITMAGGILSVGNEWNPWLAPQGADIAVLFGVANGADYASFRETYLDPANVANLDDDLFEQVPDTFGNLLPDRTKPIYAPILIAWMKANAADLLQQAYGTTDVSYGQAYDAFVTLPPLRQRSFLVNAVYFNELEMTSRPDGPSYLQYSRGYRAVNTLFSPTLGYTENNLEGGAAGASETIETGNLDLRLATIQTARGGSISLLGPGGRILAGSTVRTSDQAARRTYSGTRLYAGDRILGLRGDGNPLIGFSSFDPAAISAIPTGFEGIITLRGGAVRSFTDQSLLLNQSRLFTQDGGNITLWSSNGDLNAGQGPKTAANFPPVVVRINADTYAQVDAVGGVAGAGIAAFQPEPGVAAPDVFLIAPRGTVDAGDAGVRVAGNLFVAAAAVANADNFKVGGTAVGVVSSPVVDAGAVAASNAASAAASQAATSAAAAKPVDRSQIYVDVQGYTGDKDRCAQDPRPADCPAQ